MTQTFATTWSLYSAGKVPLADAFDLAFGISCTDGEWELNADPDAAAAALLTLGDDIYDLQRSCDHQGFFARLGAYDRIRVALEAIYPDAEGNVTDPWTAETYSELFKDDYGYRPSGKLDGTEMRAWIARRALQVRHGVSID